jgi:hypothetical protein
VPVLRSWRAGNIMKRISCLFVIAMLASPESMISNARANTSFDGAWNVQITMDRGNCEPINRLTVDILDGALQHTAIPRSQFRTRWLVTVRSGCASLTAITGSVEADDCRRVLAPVHGMASVWRVPALVAGRLNATDLVATAAKMA